MVFLVCHGSVNKSCKYSCHSCCFSFYAFFAQFFGGGGIGAPHSPGIGPSPVPGPTHASPYHFGPTPIPTPVPAPSLAPSRAPYDHIHPAAEKTSKPTPKDGAGEGAKSSGDNGR